MSKRSKACEFSPAVRREIYERDGGQCFFCKMFGYSGHPPTQYAHYRPRSQGGLGVAENGAYICVIHHQALDNGVHGKRLKEAYRNYLKKMYPEWNEEDLIYSKWSR